MPADVDAAVKFLTSQDNVNSNALGVVGGDCGANQAVHAAERHPTVRTLVLMSGGAAALAARYAKYLLIAGLTLFAVGIGYIAWTAQVSSNRWSFVPGLVIAGVGMAGIWTPVYSLATRDLQPRLAGVASGVISTVQELGAVIGSAAIGALLQNQLASDLHNRAVSYSAQLPSQAQAPFVDGFSKAANAGLQVGRGQTGTSLALPAGVPAQLVHQIQLVAHAVFTQAFVDGRPVGNLTRDEVLDNITLTWFTNTGISSARLYHENTHGFFDAKGVSSVPVAVSVFPRELYQAPRSWTEQAYPNLIYYNVVDRGDHFAAWQEPQLFSQEVRAAFRSLR